MYGLLKKFFQIESKYQRIFITKFSFFFTTLYPFFRVIKTSIENNFDLKFTPSTKNNTIKVIFTLYLAHVYRFSIISIRSQRKIITMKPKLVDCQPPLPPSDSYFKENLELRKNIDEVQENNSFRTIFTLKINFLPRKTVNWTICARKYVRVTKSGGGGRGIGKWLKSELRQKARLGPILNLCINFQLFSSIWWRVMRGTSSKPKKEKLPKKHIYGL